MLTDRQTDRQRQKDDLLDRSNSTNNAPLCSMLLNLPLSDVSSINIKNVRFLASPAHLLMIVIVY